MSLFGNLTTEGLEKAEDRLGGYAVKPTDIYLAKIKLAYAGQSQGGARNVTLVLETEQGEYTETVYVTNKNGENFFLNKQDQSKKVPLPGFTLIDDLCLVTTDKPLAQQNGEEKVVKIYDYEQKKEVPKSVPVLVDLLGKEAYFAIVAQTVNKNQKNDSTGEYEPIAETRDENVIEKIFHNPTKMTVVEVKSGAQEAVFFHAWLEKNKGNTRDKRTIKDGQAGAAKSGRPGQNGNAPTSGGGAKSTPSLFGGNK